MALVEVLAACGHLSRCAGVIVRHVFESGSLDVVQKGVDDPQTVADRRAQYCIVESLRRAWPELTIVGEEGECCAGLAEDVVDLSGALKDSPFRFATPAALSATLARDITVWVDPLDGTKEFTQGHKEHVTVLIGLGVNGRAVGGVVHRPFATAATKATAVGAAAGEAAEATQHIETAVALEGAGARLFAAGAAAPDAYETRLPAPATHQDSTADLVVTTTRSHPSPLLQSVLQQLAPKEIIRVGGSGNKVLMLLEGQCNAYVYPSPGTKKWDTCAGEALLRAIGGTLTDSSGHTYSYASTAEHLNATGVVATLSAAMHQRVISTIAHLSSPSSS